MLQIMKLRHDRVDDKTWMQSADPLRLAEKTALAHFDIIEKELVINTINKRKKYFCS